MEERSALLVFHLLPGIGPLRTRDLLDHFRTAASALAASRSDLRAVLGGKLATVVSTWEEQVDLPAEWEAVRSGDARVVTWADEDYPALLRQIHSPPVAIYVRGSLSPSDAQSIAVVGTRQMTRYGREATRRLSFQIARAGFTVVSGLAYGVDTAAHEAALAAGGRTLAVLGSGLNRLYPPENAALAEQITRQGALISQFAMDTKAEPRLFPARNLTVSGLCRGILITEGNLKSGSMLTAKAALDQNRDVFAVPGPIDRPGSAGPNSLIRDGARLVRSFEDLAEDLEWGGPPTGREPDREMPELPGLELPDIQLSAEERSVLDSIGREETSVERVVQKTGLPPSTVSSTLMRLQLRRLIRQGPGQSYARD